MKNAITFISEEALDSLGINYRKFPFKNGMFYCCKILSNGYTFDLQCDDDNVIRMWRFVNTAPISMAGKRYEYRNPNYTNNAVVGVEVTEEGDVSFYTEQKIDVNASDNDTRISRMIRRYVNMITDTSFVRYAL